MENKASPLEPGTVAPDFSLPETPDQSVGLSDFKGRTRVVLVFYPADFSPVCSSEVALFNEMMPELRRHGAQILGISVDSVWSHLAFGKEKNLRFPLLSDFNPKGEVSKRYHAYRAQEGESARALYLIGRDGKIAWSYLSPVGINPGVDGVLQALEDLDKKKGGAP